jgi:hypothetical protein
LFNVRRLATRDRDQFGERTRKYSVREPLDLTSFCNLLSYRHPAPTRGCGSAEDVVAPGYRSGMTAAESAPAPDRPPFADASPAQVRAALLPEDATEFDRQWQDVMARATRELDLTEVHRTLNTWRRVAWVTTATGPERYRAVLASAEERRHTGERHPQATPWHQLKAELGLPE